MTIADLAYAGLEQALNHHISMAPQAKRQMAQLHGKVIALEILGTNQTMYLVPGPEMVQLLSSYEGIPDCTLQGSPMTIAQLRRPIADGSSPIPEGMQVLGDQELAQRFCSILRQIEINWEQYLSQYTGSLIATEVGKILNFADYWCDHIIDTIGQDASEYLQQEASILPARHEIEEFSSNVNLLTKRLEKLQQRISALKPKGLGR
jgi:ubiquinone biosynthesis accessory factor UbiJ